MARLLRSLERTGPRSPGKERSAMSRAIWNGHITFGLIEIPVSLAKAEETREQLRFSLVDRRDHAPVGYLRVNKRTGEEVSLEDIARGYELESGDFVLLSSEELEAANPEATHSVEILDFVDAADIHPAYFATPYYLEPSRKQASKAYALLREALVRTGRAGIARVVLRTRQYIAALLPFGPALALALLRYEHELRRPEELELPAEDLAALDVRDEELRMAEQLVQSMTTSWQPERYHDEYFRDVMALVERKVAEGRTEPSPAERRGAVERPEPEDLMPLLKESVERRARERQPRPSRASPTPPRRREKRTPPRRA